MEISSALLVAIMFVVLLTIGIGNILMSLAAMVDRRSPVTASRMHISWIILLLLMYLSLFWHTIDVLSVEEWTFVEFLYVMLGPVLILFASQVLLPNSSSTDSGELNERYFEISRPFFVFLAASQVWVNGVDLILRDGLTRFGAINGVAAVFALILAFSHNRAVHLVLTAAMWLLFLTAWVIRGLG
jgi:hypothetical protein